MKIKNLLSGLLLSLSVIVTSSTAVNYAYSHKSNLKATEVYKNFNFDGKNSNNTKVNELF
ncbi:hypothetical protein [Mesoplasma melaleucae]|uniref:Uncharacterized protein n=1 Tax=Mesoplasma melaleucae TaxID=81459 RepID=A0A2K8NY54_9MOLU|nr:hypothetical protein [Mesoplasma melaleucae]ATZ18108.1 hypothetical protein EMELA_v1c05830 [Mesoplasma melaleucae]